VGETGGAPRDRRVLLIIAALVVGILLVNLVSALVPGLDGALAALPIVVLMLVVGTVVILARSLRR
jgi:hypothetical protein